MSLVPQDSLAALPATSETSVSHRPVLARDADATYWMSRYVERAEHVARLLLVNSEALMDVGDVAAPLLQRHWQSVLKVMSVGEGVKFDDVQTLPQKIALYMSFDQENPNSLIRCLTRARENARGIREVISSEMWEHLNMLYWSIRSDESKSTFQELPDQFYEQVITGSILFQGLTDQTLLHGQRWYFTQLGKYFERINLVCRTLKMKHDILLAEEATGDTPLVNIHWSTVLRSCGSIEAYRLGYLGEVDLPRTIQFLIFQAEFPRSVRYCVKQAHRAIAAIRAAIRPRTIDLTERILGRLDAQLEFSEPEELLADGLGERLDKILACIHEAALSLQRSFFLH
ncbi:MAG TPA: alpha-E domain-containing protein [Tepidisphaeraceae bacterium]|jgi:uncharacterized alpha-E superfamily protein